MSLQQDLNNLDWTDFHFSDFLKGEREILKPKLETLGYTKIEFYTAEGDSFGPLSRGVVAINKENQSEKASYG